jgi:hypothetical protein
MNDEAKARLREVMPKQTRLYTLVVKKTRNTRYVKVFVVFDSRIINVTGRLCAAGIFTWNDRNEGIPLRGHGYGAASTVAEKVGQAVYDDPQALQYEYLD